MKICRYNLLTTFCQRFENQYEMVIFILTQHLFGEQILFIYNFPELQNPNRLLVKTLVCLLIFVSTVASQTNAQIKNENIGKNDTIKYLSLPERPAYAVVGSMFASQITGLSLEEREKAIVKEIFRGNVPSFSRKLKALTITKAIDTTNYKLTFYTVCDYLAIGSDADYLYIPLTPSTAQFIADSLRCTLPTKKIVDIVYDKSDIKLYPQPIPPSDKMTTVPVFKHHTDSINLQIAQIGFDRSADFIIAGHKKDIIISNKIYSNDRNYDRVVIYGWHLSVDNPIQPVYNGHIATYADYSHGVRLISDTVLINGTLTTIEEILKDTKLWVLLSDEGIISKPYYPPSDIFTTIQIHEENDKLDFQLNQNYPNPFGQGYAVQIPSTTITYSLGKQAPVNLKIYNLLGQEIVTLIEERQTSGIHSIHWNGKDKEGNQIPAGVYVYNLKVGNAHLTKKMLYVK